MVSATHSCQCVQTMAWSALPIPVSVCRQWHGQRYPFLSVCADNGMVSATHCCQCVQTMAWSALPIAVSVCRQWHGTHCCQCVQTMAWSALPIAVSVCRQWHGQRYPLLSVCADNGMVSATHCCQCVQTMAWSALPIPVRPCSVFLCPDNGMVSATHSCQCVQTMAWSALPIPVRPCSVFLCPDNGMVSATHSCQCVQCFPVSRQWHGQRYPFLSVCVVLSCVQTMAWSALPIPVSVCSVFLCPDNGMVASVWDLYVRNDAEACDCTLTLRTS